MGLDQANINPLPRSLSGAGRVNIVLTVAGQTAAPVEIVIKRSTARQERAACAGDAIPVVLKIRRGQGDPTMARERKRYPGVSSESAVRG